ncbi:hypothetical protein BDF21DRAFT_337238 [Thamnidium elegans]|nr:hypothetical protein BDF21DRAFT_337238 [Thamnidium elegans]
MKITFILLVLMINVIYVHASCEWFGTAPFCEGSCPPGWSHEGDDRHSEVGPDGNESNPGFGLSCYTGTKALCCSS